MDWSRVENNAEPLYLVFDQAILDDDSGQPE